VSSAKSLTGGKKLSKLGGTIIAKRSEVTYLLPASLMEGRNLPRVVLRSAPPPYLLPNYFVRTAKRDGGLANLVTELVWRNM
jgi:hypothetical protein